MEVNGSSPLYLVDAETFLFLINVGHVLRASEWQLELEPSTLRLLLVLYLFIYSASGSWKPISCSLELAVTLAVDWHTDKSVRILCTCVMKCLKGLFQSHDSHSRHTVPPAHFSREDSQAQFLPSAFCVQRQRWETRQILPSWSCLWVGSTHMINETITNNVWFLWCSHCDEKIQRHMMGCLVLLGRSVGHSRRNIV